jgi:N-hydroxyarylamine O-acetyltransferase
MTVPFENIDIVRGIEILLDAGQIYEKIVIRKRGGFCYELNGLFYQLLGMLGFSVSMVSGRVYRPKIKGFTPEFDHMVLLVHLDRTYLVDVGFGQSMRVPLALPEGEAEDVDGRYQVEPLAQEPDSYLLQVNRAGMLQPVYRFSNTPRELSDFEGMCHYNQTSPDAPFTQGMVCTVTTERGRLTLLETRFTITEDGEKRIRNVSSPDECRRLLSSHFGIVP